MHITNKQTHVMTWHDYGANIKLPSEEEKSSWGDTGAWSVVLTWIMCKHMTWHGMTNDENMLRNDMTKKQTPNMT